MVTEPLISIILPVYNRATISKTIDSILTQTYKNFELLIIDNASTDGTVAAIQKYDDKRIKLIINKKNMGQTYSLNVGIAEASGKYIARIDSDDIALPHRIETQVNYMETNRNCVLCGSWVRIINENNVKTFTLKVPTSDRAIRVLQKFGCAFYHPSVIMKRDCLQQNGLRYNEDYKYAQDYELWSRILIYGEGHNIPDVLTYYRRDAGNESRKKNVEKLMYAEAYNVQLFERAQIEDISLRKCMIDILNKERTNLSLLQIISIAKCYKKYIENNYDLRDDDYDILIYNLKLKLYRECIVNNDTVFSNIVNYILRKYKKYLENKMKK